MQSSFCGGINQLRGHKSTARAWKRVTDREVCCTGLQYAYGHYSEIYPEIIFYHKRVIFTPAFGDIITRDRLKLICKFLHFTNSETIDNFQGPKKFFKMFPLI